MQLDFSIYMELCKYTATFIYLFIFLIQSF